MREQAISRMAPLEKMDLTGRAPPVIESIYGQFFQEARYRLSLVTQLRYMGGLLGR